MFSVLALIAGCTMRSNHANKFIRDIPDIKSGKSETLLGIQATADSLQLARLENGFDSLQIRVWLTYSKKDTLQVITIKKQNKRWSGYYCQVTFSFNEHRDSILYYKNCGFSIKPILDWQVLVDTFIKHNILTLPDCRKIMSTNEFPFDGGNSVLFEISTANQYRIYMYEIPSHFKKKYKEAENVDEILTLLSKQFAIKYLGNF
jgi:hypothetical protein